MVCLCFLIYIITLFYNNYLEELGEAMHAVNRHNEDRDKSLLADPKAIAQKISTLEDALNLKDPEGSAEDKLSIKNKKYKNNIRKAAHTIAIGNLIEKEIDPEIFTSEKGPSDKEMDKLMGFLQSLSERERLVYVVAIPLVKEEEQIDTCNTKRLEFLYNLDIDSFIGKGRSKLPSPDDLFFHYIGDCTRSYEIFLQKHLEKDKLERFNNVKAPIEKEKNRIESLKTELNKMQKFSYMLELIGDQKVSPNWMQLLEEVALGDGISSPSGGVYQISYDGRLVAVSVVNPDLFVLSYDESRSYGGQPIDYSSRFVVFDHGEIIGSSIFQNRKSFHTFLRRRKKLPILRIFRRRKLPSVFLGHKTHPLERLTGVKSVTLNDTDSELSSSTENKKSLTLCLEFPSRDVETVIKCD